MVENGKVHPFWSEKFVSAAIVCKQCGSIIPGFEDILEYKAPASNHKEDYLLPENYSAPDHLIDRIYSRGILYLQFGGWNYVKGIPPPSLIFFNHNKFYEWVDEISDKAWEHGGKTPESIVKWLDSNIRIWRNYEAVKAAQKIRLHYYDEMKSEIRGKFEYFLRRLVKGAVVSSRSNEDALKKLAILLETKPIAIRLELEDEAKRHINNINITENNCFIPVSEVVYKIPGIAQTLFKELEVMCAEVLPQN